MTNTMLLSTRIKESGLKLIYICDKLGLTWRGLTMKIRGETEFKQSEIAGLQALLDLSDAEVKEIFFTSEVEKISTEGEEWI